MEVVLHEIRRTQMQRVESRHRLQALLQVVQPRDRAVAGVTLGPHAAEAHHARHPGPLDGGGDRVADPALVGAMVRRAVVGRHHREDRRRARERLREERGVVDRSHVRLGPLPREFRQPVRAPPDGADGDAARPQPARERPSHVAGGPGDDHHRLRPCPESRTACGTPGSAAGWPRRRRPPSPSCRRRSVPAPRGTRCSPGGAAPRTGGPP